MSRRTHAKLTGPWLAAFGLLGMWIVMMGGTAAAETARLSAGAGARFNAGDTAAVGALRLDVALEPMILLAIELDGYLSGADGARAFDLAGGQALLVGALPVPGPITPEAGLGLGLVKLDPSRHGVDDSLLTVNLELGVRWSLGPVSLRAAYTYPLWTEDDRAALGLESQLMFTLGVGL